MLRLAIPLFVATLLAACAVQGPGEDSGFSCETNDDCISPNVCCNGECVPASSGCGECLDDDGDGFGKGDSEARSICPLCVQNGECAEDCDDSNDAVYPGASEVCDGTDNDCDEEVDEPNECETSTDCPADGNLIGSCDDGACLYGPPLQDTPECQITLACVGGARETAPDACM